MKVEVDTTSAVPAYEQIRLQVTALVTSGRLLAGSRLPTIRQLAGDLELAPGTVAKAYRQLEETGIVTSQRRRGTLVCDVAVTDQDIRLGELTHAADHFARTAATLNVDADTALAAVATSLAQFLD